MVDRLQDISLNTFFDVQGKGPFGQSSKKGPSIINKKIENSPVLSLENVLYAHNKLFFLRL